jgi:spoIIIJ-associated protein
MSKKSFFSFLKGWSNVSEEEEKDSKSSKKSSSRSNFRPDVTEEMETFAVEKLEEMLELTTFEGSVRAKKRDGNKLFLEVFDAGEDAGRIIGKGGSTLESFQTLLRHFIIRRFDAAVRVTIDAGDYRNKRGNQLKNKALKAAEEVEKYGSRVELDPMTASERRAIHMLFENSDTVETLSEGQGNDRRIVLVRRDG